MKFLKFNKKNVIDLFLLIWKYFYDIFLSGRVVFSIAYIVLFYLGEMCIIIEVIEIWKGIFE